MDATGWSTWPVSACGAAVDGLSRGQPIASTAELRPASMSRPSTRGASSGGRAPPRTPRRARSASATCCNTVACTGGVSGNRTSTSSATVPAVLDATTTQCRQVTSSSGLTAKPGHPAVDDHLTDREDGHRTGGVASAGGRCTHVTATLNAAAVLP